MKKPALLFRPADSANYSDWEGRILLYGGEFKVNKREIHRKEKICFILQKKTVNK